jgi:hypothetical protein
MDDPIADGGFMDMSQFRIVDIKIDILAVPISFMDQFAMKSKEIISQMPLEKLDIGLAPFSSFEIVPRFEKIFYRDDLLN